MICFEIDFYCWEIGFCAATPYKLYENGWRWSIDFLCFSINYYR